MEIILVTIPNSNPVNGGYMGFHVDFGWWFVGNRGLQSVLVSVFTEKGIYIHIHIFIYM